MRKKELEDSGIFCGIIQRRVRGQEKLTPEQKRHNKKVAKVRGIVEMPFAWLRKTRGYADTLSWDAKKRLRFWLVGDCL